MKKFRSVKRYSWMIGLGLMCLSSLASAEDAAEDAASRLLEYLNNMQTFTAVFSQTVTSESGEEQEHLRGRVAIARPGKFRWQVEEPYSQFLVADGTYLWQYDPDLEQATVRNQDTAMANTPAEILSERSSQLQQRFKIRRKVQNDKEQFILEPLEGEGFSRITIEFEQGRLGGLTLLDNLGQVTEVVFSQITVNGPISESEFHLSLPDGVDIVDSRDHGNR